MSRSPLIVTASPHLDARDSTPEIMWAVVWTLLPIIAAAIYFFGPSALVVIGASTAGAVVTERLLARRGSGSLSDGTATITGVLLGLTLPATCPAWMAFAGGAFGIGFGKLVFGGLGQNVFNPALLGRAFLQAAFPVAMTTWPSPERAWWALRGDNFALPFTSPVLDTVTGATPLGLFKFEQTPTGLWDLVLGTTSGSLGETSGLLILLCGGYLALRNFLNWRIPAAIFLTVALMALPLSLLDPVRFPGPMAMLFSGGLILGAMYMATDPVTSPVTAAGCWVFGIGIGLLVMIIRLWGGLAEGVMYAILLMNALVPFINRATQPRRFGNRTIRLTE